MDFVYVYTNSKVLGALKENDEKKWYDKNLESEDLDGPILEDEISANEHDGEVHEDGEDSAPLWDDKDALNLDRNISNDEFYGSPE